MSDINETQSSNRFVKLVSFGLIYRIIDSILLFVVLLLQNTTISYYLTYYNDGNSFWYFFFFADFVLVFLFISGSIFASRHYRKLEGLKHRRIRSSSSHRNKNDSKETTVDSNNSKHGIFNIRFPKQLGTLPLLWICWVAYVLLLAVKVFILHLQDIPYLLSKSSIDHKMERSLESEPHNVKLCLASMTIVFLLWIEIHRNHNSNRSYECIKELTTAVVFEIFDSIDLLDLLLPEKVSEDLIRPSPLPDWLSLIILILTTFNLLLPTIGLFQLSQRNFDSYKLGLRMNIIHNSLRIGLVNIPYLLLRVCLWKTWQKEISIFLLKNALFIFVSFRHLISDVHQLRKLKKNTSRTNSIIEENELPLSVVFDANNKSTSNGGDTQS